MEIPKKVSVATDADFKVNLGTIKYNLSDSLSSESITEKMKENLGDSMQLYRYVAEDKTSTTDVDESDVLAYVIHYPVYEIPLDVGKYLENLDFGSEIGNPQTGFNFNENIEIPEVSGSSTTSVGITVLEDFKDAINSTLDSKKLESNGIPEPQILTAIENKYGPVEVVSEAERIFYKSGSGIKLRFSKTDSNPYSDTYNLSSRAYISSDVGGTNVIVSSGDEPVEIIKNGVEKNDATVVLPLDTAEGLPGEFYIWVVGIASGGNDAVTHDLVVSLSLKDGSDLQRVQNIKKHSSDLGIEPYEFDMFIDMSSMTGTFESAEIKDGQISLTTNENAEGWSGVDTTINMSFGGTAITPDKITDGPAASTVLFDKVVSLEGTSLVPSSEPIEVGGSVSIEVYGATIDFTDDIANFDITYSYEVNRLKDVVIDLTTEKYSNIQTSFMLNDIVLSNSLTDFVKKINFGEESPAGSGVYKKRDASGGLTLDAEGLGFEFTVTNTLPTDDIVIKIDSEMFDYHLTKNIGTTSDSGEVQKWVQYPELDFSGLDSSQTNYVDYKFEFENTRITLDEVEMGHIYNFGMSFDSMIFDWNWVSLTTSSSAVSGSNQLDSFNMSSLLEGLSFASSSIKNIHIASVPAFFHMQKPSSTNTSYNDLLDGIGLSGTMSIDYEYKTGDAGNEVTHNETLQIIDGTVHFMDEVIPWPSDPNAIITTDEMADILAAKADPQNPGVYDSAVLPYITEGTDNYSFMTDLADIINLYPENMEYKYNLALSSSSGSEAKIYHSWTSEANSSSGDSTSINVDMAIILSFDLELIDDVTIDIMSFYNEDWDTDLSKDLLNRDSASSFEEYTKYCDAISSFGLTYTVKNNVFSGLDLSASFADAASSINKTISLKENAVNTLYFSGIETKNILTSYPFHPTASMCLAGGTASNPKNLIISRANMDSEEGACLSATVSVMMDCTDRHAITVWGD